MPCTEKAHSLKLPSPCLSPPVSDFTARLQVTGLPVIVDFYSDGCGPCRQVWPVNTRVCIKFHFVSTAQNSVMQTKQSSNLVWFAKFEPGLVTRAIPTGAVALLVAPQECAHKWLPSTRAGCPHLQAACRAVQEQGGVCKGGHQRKLPDSVRAADPQHRGWRRCDQANTRPRQTHRICARSCAAAGGADETDAGERGGTARGGGQKHGGEAAAGRTGVPGHTCSGT